MPVIVSAAAGSGLRAGIKSEGSFVSRGGQQNTSQRNMFASVPNNQHVISNMWKRMSGVFDASALLQAGEVAPAEPLVGSNGLLTLSALEQAKKMNSDHKPHTCHLSEQILVEHWSFDKRGAEQSWVSSVEEFEQAFLPVTSAHTQPQNRPFCRDTKSDGSLAQHVAHLLSELELEASTPRVTLGGPAGDTLRGPPADTHDPPSSSPKNFFSYQGPKQSRAARGEWFHSYGVNSHILDLIRRTLDVQEHHIFLTSQEHDEGSQTEFVRGDVPENDYVIVVAHELKLESAAQRQVKLQEAKTEYLKGSASAAQQTIDRKKQTSRRGSWNANTHANTHASPNISRQASSAAPSPYGEGRHLELSGGEASSRSGQSDSCQEQGKPNVQHPFISQAPTVFSGARDNRVAPEQVGKGEATRPPAEESRPPGAPPPGKYGHAQEGKEGEVSGQGGRERQGEREEKEREERERRHAEMHGEFLALEQYQVVMFLFPERNLLISFGELDIHGPVVEACRDVLQNRKSAVVSDLLDETPGCGNGAATLLVVMLDATMDLTFPIMDTFSNALEGLRLMSAQYCSEFHVATSNQIKMQMTQIRRFVWDSRALFMELSQDMSGALGPVSRMRAHVLLESTTQLEKEAEANMEQCQHVEAIYSGVQDAKMNSSLFFLTRLSMLCIPVQTISGWYGMNFEMPDGALALDGSDCSRKDTPLWDPCRWLMPELSYRFSYIVVSCLALSWIFTLALSFTYTVWKNRQNPFARLRKVKDVKEI